MPPDDRLIRLIHLFDDLHLRQLGIGLEDGLERTFTIHVHFFVGC